MQGVVSTMPLAESRRVSKRERKNEPRLPIPPVSMTLLVKTFVTVSLSTSIRYAMNSVTPSSGIVEFPSSFSPNWTFPSLMVFKIEKPSASFGHLDRPHKTSSHSPENHSETPEDRVLLVLRKTDDVHGLERLGEIGSVVDGRDVKTS